MRPELEARRETPDGGRHVFAVDEEQFHLLRRALVTYLGEERDPVARALVLGPDRAGLEAALQVERNYADVVPGPLPLTFDEVRGLYGMLLTVATFWPASEEDFVKRVGHFRETVRQLAGLLVWALRGSA
ncbi:MULTISPECIES: hypothetical protein [Streptomyces]|uniref:TetR family transcriptional regulator n=1 Tax=Streptomyces solicathayae TaxID=3081768 RepID=A0ABZ0LSC1_9ACTN|nr:hypothetical protein [Streptomyces sp. HUAS YS2]WOX22339.1 hypothetical protein R2D22_13420 [Streptomyces sp. HUAS YS2]